MITAQRLLRRRVEASGQESVTRLLYAPFAFITHNDTDTLSSLFVSAISFLEGYSCEDVESSVELDEKEGDRIVANCSLIMVPYKAPVSSNEMRVLRDKSVDTRTQKKVITSSIEKHCEPSREVVSYYTRFLAADSEINCALKTEKYSMTSKLIATSIETGINISDEALLCVLAKLSSKNHQSMHSESVRKIMQYIEANNYIDSSIVAGVAVRKEEVKEPAQLTIPSSRLANRRKQRAKDK